MSLRRGNELQEAVEQVAAVVRTGPSLGVVLHGTARHVQQLQPLDRAVVEVDVRKRGATEVRLPAHGLVVRDRALALRSKRGEAMVLGGDLHAARAQVLDRVIGAAMAEGQLERLQSQRSAQQLVAQA